MESEDQEDDPFPEIKDSKLQHATDSERFVVKKKQFTLMVSILLVFCSICNGRKTYNLNRKSAAR